MTEREWLVTIYQGDGTARATSVEVEEFCTYTTVTEAHASASERVALLGRDNHFAWVRREDGESVGYLLSGMHRGAKQGRRADGWAES